MKELFNPDSIALIGASRSREKVGYVVFKNLLKSGKKVYAVNPNAKKILGQTSYVSVKDIPGKVDLAVIAIPAKFVPAAIEECGIKGVKAAIIISAGFSEAGNPTLEKQLLEAAQKHRIRILGPNCLGIIMPFSKINSAFFEQMPEKGSIAFISQSGALGVAVLDWAVKEKMGLSAFVSVGNAADIDFPYLINYFENDSHTKVICLYIESLKEGRKFLDAASVAKKPIVVLKAGRTKAGERAAVSHTAALATEDKIYDGVFKQYNLLRADSLQQMFTAAEFLTVNKAPKGRRGLIITNAGGPGVLASDAFEKNKIEVVQLPAELINNLNAFLPGHWSHNNPIDIIGDALPERYSQTLEEVKGHNFYDFIMLILTPQEMSDPSDVAKILVNFHKKTGIPCFGCMMGGKRVEQAKTILKDAGLLNFEEPEQGAGIISRMIK
jgi:acetyltransferase